MLPSSIIQQITALQEYLNIIDASFIINHIKVECSKGWVTYRDPDKNWYHFDVFPRLDVNGEERLILFAQDNYLKNFLESYREEYTRQFSASEEELILKRKYDEWKSKIFKDYSRQEHIKNLVWALSDECEEALRQVIESIAQEKLSPNERVNFNEFHADGMCFEIVSHNSPRLTSADMREVRLKALDGIFGGYAVYGRRKAALPGTSFIRISREIYHPSLGRCKIVEIAAGVFDYLTNVEVLELPNTLRRVEWSLWHCRKLKEIRIFNSYDARGFKTVDGVLFSGDLKTLIAYPNCHGAEYEVPEGVERIAPKAFKDCTHLRTLRLPSSLKSIGINAFYRCENLEMISANASEESIKFEGFFGNYGNVNPKWMFQYK